MQGTEPIMAVYSLDFEKVNNKMPVVIRNCLTVDRRKINEKTGLIDTTPSTLTDIKKTYGNPFVDCDGDALWVNGNMNTWNSINFPEPLDESEIKNLSWGDGIDAKGQKLLTTVIMDANRGYPLGVAYSSMQSVIENFRPKKITGPDTVEYRFLTLHSRSRGIWPKGMKNPNADKDNDPLPQELELSSGNYLLTREIFSKLDGSALLFMASVPARHGFCHHSYLYDKAGKSTTVYESDKNLPDGARSYTSCFHKVLLKSGLFRSITG